ncbi:Putative gamma-glutamylcyclotransferase ykqA [Mycobacteroides abscessus subsp. abscessus]|nr:Putative gamma-glutamylcyclotransferase ykqA [Mycobacteroides abscessus subsp. abscessus]
MKYLLERPDGGRGDIIEDGGLTEGILYRLPYDAVEYLFIREGFHGGLYRPVFVDIKSEGILHKNVLSFHVYNKRDELAPPGGLAGNISRS